VSLDRLIAPRSIVVVGASPDLAKLPGRPLAYLERFGFAGTVYAVNPKYDRIGPYRCFPSVDALPESVDLALILLPAPAVAEALEACGRKGIPFAISIASGFAEAGDHARQAELLAICRRYGIRLVGPNCVGMLVPEGAVTATFSTELGRAMPRTGSIALVTQSGALGNALLQGVNSFGLGLRAWISTGNEADLGLLDFLEYFTGDPHTDVIALFTEGLRDGAKLVPLLRRARAAGKALVALRAGRSEAGRGASASHTGKLAGAFRVWSGLARQGGLIEVDSLDEMLDVLRAFQALGPPSIDETASLGVLTVSGGLGVVIADRAAEYGLALPRFGVETMSTLRELLPPQMSVANPVDTALFTSADGYARCAELVLGDPAVRVLVLVISSLSHRYDELAPWLRQLGESARALGKSLAATYLSSTDQLAPATQIELLEAGLLALPSAERTVAAIGRWVTARKADDALDAPAAMPGASGRDMLAAAGIPQPRQKVCISLLDATAYAETIGYPVALKVASPDILHKTEVGGVRIGLADADALRRGWAEMEQSLKAKAPHARIEGFQVQEMVTDAVELIVGCSRDPEFGPVLMIGWGGIYTEVLEDVAFLALPATWTEIERALSGLRVSKLIDGVRGLPAADREAAVDAIARLGAIFVAEGLSELDVNPLLLRPRSAGVVAVDVLAIQAP
jgi:acyl-CoA synthetase (NDP forming)